MLDVGCWTLDVGRWMLDVGCWTLDVGRWMLDVGCWTLDVGCSMLDVGCSMLDVRCWMFDVGSLHLRRSPFRSPPGTGRSLGHSVLKRPHAPTLTHPADSAPPTPA